MNDSPPSRNSSSPPSISTLTTSQRSRPNSTATSSSRRTMTLIPSASPVRPAFPVRPGLSHPSVMLPVKSASATSQTSAPSPLAARFSRRRAAFSALARTPPRGRYTRPAPYRGQHSHRHRARPHLREGGRATGNAGRGRALLSSRPTAASGSADQVASSFRRASSPSARSAADLGRGPPADPRRALPRNLGARRKAAEMRSITGANLRHGIGDPGGAGPTLGIYSAYRRRPCRKRPVGRVPCLAKRARSRLSHPWLRN